MVAQAFFDAGRAFAGLVKKMGADSERAYGAAHYRDAMTLALNVTRDKAPTTIDSKADAQKQVCCTPCDPLCTVFTLGFLSVWHDGHRPGEKGAHISSTHALALWFTVARACCFISSDDSEAW